MYYKGNGFVWILGIDFRVCHGLRRLSEYGFRPFSVCSDRLLDDCSLHSCEGLFLGYRRIGAISGKDFGSRKA